MTYYCMISQSIESKELLLFAIDYLECSKTNIGANEEVPKVTPNGQGIYSFYLIYLV